MNKSQLAKDLQNRLSSLLKDPVFAKARQNRALQSKVIIEDALIAHNMAASEEILHLDPSSIHGVVKDKHTGNHRYCGWKAKHLEDDFSLCRFCNCRPWPEATGSVTS